MAKYYKICEMLEEELDKIAMSDKLTTSSLEVGDKAAHFLKNIKTIEAMEDEGESYGDYMMQGESYARGGGRGRGAYAKRDSRGRYASERGGGYSRANKREMMMELEELKNRIDNMED